VTAGLGPMLPPHLRQTFEVDRPLATHWRVVTCAVAALIGECPDYAEGCDMECNAADPELGTYRAKLRAAGYRWVETESSRFPGFIRFYFPPEQNCWDSRDMPHVIPRERMPILRVVDGDWRAPGTVKRVHVREDDFVDDLRTTVDTLATEYERG
jgi:hypothetical protein